jgi:fructose-1,6-bisphosphatase/inositol monophosphatase family enzyme
MELFGRDSLHVEYKDDKSPVTEADLKTQQFLLDELTRLFPAIPVVSEERTLSENRAAMADLFFIVDPLDSTKNFASGIPFFDVSIALVKDGVSVIGVVHDPVHRTTYAGVRGIGAWRNGQPIHTRQCNQLADADLDMNVTRLPPGRIGASRLTWLLPLRKSDTLGAQYSRDVG